MSKKVIVRNIAEKASEKTVKDFFLFCGKIKDFDLIKEECCETQMAYVTFERDTAAKTALMLSSAVIGDSQITVSPADGPCTEEESDGGFGQEDKPKGAIFAEILASGYSLQDTILDKGIEFDNRYGVSNLFKQYLCQFQDNLKTLDQKYQVSNAVTTRAVDINTKYSVLNGAKYIISQATNKINNFFETSTGKVIYEYIFITHKSVSDVQSMARRIADEKKQEKNFNPTPSHSYSDDQAEPMYG